MDVPLSTLLARAKRRKRAIPFFLVPSVEIAQAVAEAAERAERGAALTVDGRREGACLPLPVMIETVGAVIRASKAELALQVLLDCDAELLVLAAEAGAQAAMVKVPEREAEARLRGLPRSAVPFLGISFAKPHPTLAIASAVRAAEASAVSMPLVEEHAGRPAVSLPFLKDLEKAVRVPLIAQGTSSSRLTIRRALPAGILGYEIGSEIGRAYTAGLRTALRDRFRDNPPAYEKTGWLAVKEAAKHYFTHIS